MQAKSRADFVIIQAKSHDYNVYIYEENREKNVYIILKNRIKYGMNRYNTKKQERRAGICTEN